MSWGIFFGNSNNKKQVVDKLFKHRKIAIQATKEIKATGLNLPLYTKKIRKKYKKRG